MQKEQQINKNLGFDGVKQLDEGVFHQLMQWSNLGRRQPVVDLQAFLQYLHLKFTLT